jgi:NAD(P)-dependent dehydrogenase (short-subunit alcohol dehydrogenase family)
MKDNQVFSNKIVVISGAAGGLGTVLVKKFADLKYQVIAIDINASGLARFNALENVITKAIDVTDLEQIRILAKDLNLDQKGLEVLVCLAGIYDTYPVTEADPALLQKILAVNLFGTASLVQGFLNPLIKSGGRVVVVSSESYKIQAMFQPYMISKSALESYCRVARQELALKGVKMVVIRPGAIRTPLLNWMSAPWDAGKYPVFDQELRDSWKKSIKMVGRIISPEKVAGKILLASTVSMPKRIYHINNNPVLKLVSLLPSGITDRLIVRILRKKGK